MKPNALLRRLFGLLLVASAASGMSPAAHADDSSLHLSFNGFNLTTGSGNLQSEARNVSGFQAIVLRSSMTLVLRQGTREGVELRADDNLLALIETEVVDRGGVPTLELGLKKGSSFSTRHPVVATIDFINLRALSISGSGEVVSEALKAPALAIAISGSGKVKLRQITTDELSAKVAGNGDLEFAGRTGKLGVSISGSGEVNAHALDADDVSVSVAGNGDAHVTARKTLAISIAGNGNVSYTGDPTVKSSIAGHGSVRKQ